MQGIHGDDVLAVQAMLPGFVQQRRRQRDRDVERDSEGLHALPLELQVHVAKFVMAHPEAGAVTTSTRFKDGYAPFRASWDAAEGVDKPACWWPDPGQVDGMVLNIDDIIGSVFPAHQLGWGTCRCRTACWGSLNQLCVL